MNLLFSEKRAPVSEGASMTTTNYLVPAGGATHAVPFEGVFGATPLYIDWRQFRVDNFPFQPQGVFVDNSQGAGPLTITIQPLGWNFIVPAGAIQSGNFPAPNGQTATITGDGQALVVFVDFPVLPAGTVVSVSGTVDVSIVSPNPVPTTPSVNSGGAPYQTTEIPALVQALYSGAITGSTVTTGNITPINQNVFLRKLILSMSANVTLAAAGLNVITATLNGNVIYKESVYINSVAQSADDGEYWSKILDFSKLGLSFGAGSLVVTVSTALASGILEVNAYAG